MPCNKNTDRVQCNTKTRVASRIHKAAADRVAEIAHRPELIDRRLAVLAQEWDVERALETMSAGASLVGLGLGRYVHKYWYALPAVVQLFFLQHALQGWCPPLPLFRRMGFRTRSEIEQERTALKALRGDFRRIEEETPGTGQQGYDAFASATK